VYPFKAILIGNDESILPNVRRELCNQDVEIEHEYPNVSSTIENLSLHVDEDRLFICKIDSDDPSSKLRRLSGAFAGRPIIVLVDSGVDAPFVVHAMRDGAAQVVMLPWVTADFHEALSSVAAQFGHSAAASRVIAVSGAHGGVGATTLAVNLAYEFAQAFQYDTIAAEISFNSCVMASHFNIEPKHTTLDLVENDQDIDVYSVHKALVRFSDKLSILSGPSFVVKAFQVEEKKVLHLIQSLRKLAKVVILDVPSTLDDLQMLTLDAADDVVLVADQSVPSLQLTREALRLGIRSYSPTVVINQFDSNVQGFDAARIKNVLSIDAVRTVALDQVAVMSAVNCGQPLRLRFPRSRALADINALARDLSELGDLGNSPVKAEGLMTSLGHVLGIC